MNFKILLTTFNLENSRTDVYEKTIRWWCENTPFQIYVTDPLNKNFNEIENEFNQLKVCRFNQSKYNGNNSSDYELHSILMVLKKFSEIEQEDGYLIKLTGKYILPNFLEEINTIPNETDIILQNRTSEYFNFKFQNTELIGFRNNLIASCTLELLNGHGKSENKNILSDIFEYKIVKYIQTHQKLNVHKLSKLFICKKNLQKRSDGSTLESI